MPRLPLPGLQRVEQRRQHARAAGADRVAERDGAAVDVHLRRIDAELAQDGHGLHRERFVQLEEIDVLQVPADLLRDLLRPPRPASSARTSARGRWSPGRRCAPAASRSSACAIAADITTSAAAPSLTGGALPAVTRAVLLERRLQRRSDSGGRVGADRLVAVEHDRVALLLRNRDRQDLGRERAAGLRGGGPAVALGGVRVLRARASTLNSSATISPALPHVAVLERAPQAVVDHRVDDLRRCPCAGLRARAASR